MVIAVLAVLALAAVVFVLLTPRVPERVLAAEQVEPPPVASGAVSGDYATYPDADWLATASAATGIPERVLAAYAGTALAVQAEHPYCNLTWTTIAAIGWVESRHGTHGGSTVAEDGKVSPPILGPVLDGTRFPAIEDTDGGQFDGDPVWDRALGPMQFLPQTWAVFAETDGDLDGIGDPHDFDDAALATGRYLCLAVDDDMADPVTWRAAVESYNRSQDYIDLVAETANGYAAAVAPSPSPSR